MMIRDRLYGVFLAWTGSLLYVDEAGYHRTLESFL